MLSELTATLPERPTTVIQPQTKLQTPTHETLHPPLVFSVHAGYLRGNYRHIVADSGDQVVVFAWTNNCIEAIAYNPRNKTAGRILGNLLDRRNSMPFTDTKLYITKSNESPDTLGHVKWKAGEYVRVWNREDKRNARCEGFCFNVATGGIGRFETGSSSLKLID